LRRCRQSATASKVECPVMATYSGTIPDAGSPGSVAPARHRRLSRRNSVFVGINLLGDLLCTTPAIRSYRRTNPEAFITYIVHNADHCRVLDGNPDIDLILYREDLSNHGGHIVHEAWLRRLPVEYDETTYLGRFDITELHRTHPEVFNDHLSQGFASLLGMKVDSVRPVVALTPKDRAVVRSRVRRPYIVFGMHSTSAVLGDGGELTRKEWVFERWLQLARRIHTWGEFDIIAVGSHADCWVESRYFRTLHGLPVRVVAALLERAACVVTVESGLSHLCHAVDAPMVLIYSKFVPFHWAFPREASRCYTIVDDPRAVSCEEVFSAVQSVLDR
jgi:ADP-heptose:LPS heptosyltransferase